MRVTRFPALCATALAFGAALAAATTADAAYPERPVTVIVPWGAGGGTDAVTRMIASLLERDLGVPFVVVNRTGGAGVVGHSATATAAPDGYTLGIVTAEIGMMHWVGQTDLTYEDYRPLALFSYDPAGVQVRADAPYENIEDLLTAIRDNPGELTGSGAGHGGIWHLALAGMLASLDISPDAVLWVPSAGAAPGLTELAAGGVDIVPSSVVEARSLMEAGRVKSLAVMAEERLEAFPDVPTLREALGIDWTIAAWRGMVGPKDLPDEVAEVMIPALRRAYESEEFREFMAGQGYGMIWREDEEFRQHMAQNDENMGSALRAAGLTE